MLEVLPRRVDVVGDEGAARADVIRTGRQHEVVDGELAAAAEQVTERACALGPFEGLGLLDLDPGQPPALGAERVEFVGHGALLGEKRLAGLKPLLARNDRVVHGRSPSVVGQPRTRWRPEASSDRKSTRLNSSHANISYAVFCLKKKKRLTTTL